MIIIFKIIIIISHQNFHNSKLIITHRIIFLMAHSNSQLRCKNAEELFKDLFKV